MTAYYAAFSSRSSIREKSTSKIDPGLGHLPGRKRVTWKWDWGLPRREIEPQEEGFSPEVMEKVLETQE